MPEGALQLALPQAGAPLGSGHPSPEAAPAAVFPPEAMRVGSPSLRMGTRLGRTDGAQGGGILRGAASGGRSVN